MKRKSGLINILLFVFVSLLCFIVTEIGLRVILFSDIKAFKILRNPNLYTDPYSEETSWILRYHLHKEEYSSPRRRPKENNKFFTRYILKDSYKHVNYQYVNNKRPVLLYGDSFAACYHLEGCFDHLLNNDTVFSKNHYLLNYGVGGYGVDQIYLLFKKSIDNYENPIVIISLMTLDLDRSILSIRESQKPFFRIENDKLKLDETPINPDPVDFFSDKKPEILSYFYRMIVYNKFARKYLPDQLVSYLKRENYYKRKKIRINEKIILETIKELKARNLDFVFLIFHPDQIRGAGSLDENMSDWRDILLTKLLIENNIPFISSKNIIKQDMAEKSLSLYDYYIKGDGHPTVYQRMLLSKKIKEYVLNYKKKQTP